MRDKDVSLWNAAARVLARRPRATMAEIAAEAGIGRATLHRRHANREDLLRAVALHALDVVGAALDAVPRRGPSDAARGFEDLVVAVVPLGERFHFLAGETWLDSDPELAPRLAALQRRVNRRLEGAREAGLLRRDVPLAWQTLLFFEVVYAGRVAIADGVLVPGDAVRAVLTALLDGQRAPGVHRRRSGSRSDA